MRNKKNESRSPGSNLIQKTDIMVKNAFGGNKSKGVARKSFIKSSQALRMADNECEIYAQVIKIVGGQMCHVTNILGEELKCHIRGKFRGKNKRDNYLANGTWVLVGLRDWTNEDSKECDLLEVYADADKIRLQNCATNVNWGVFVANDNKQTAVNVSDVVQFCDDKTEELNQLLSQQSASDAKGVAVAVVEETTLIDVDDI
jgi:translation initiation factor IF-1